MGKFVWCTLSNMKFSQRLSAIVYLCLSWIDKQLWLPVSLRLPSVCMMKQVLSGNGGVNEFSRVKIHSIWHETRTGIIRYVFHQCSISFCRLVDNSSCCSCEISWIIWVSGRWQAEVKTGKGNGLYIGSRTFMQCFQVSALLVSWTAIWLKAMPYEVGPVSNRRKSIQKNPLEVRIRLERLAFCVQHFLHLISVGLKVR